MNPSIAILHGKHKDDVSANKSDVNRVLLCRVSIGKEGIHHRTIGKDDQLRYVIPDVRGVIASFLVGFRYSIDAALPKSHVAQPYVAAAEKVALPAANAASEQQIHALTGTKFDKSAEPSHNASADDKNAADNVRPSDSETHAVTRIHALPGTRYDSQPADSHSVASANATAKNDDLAIGDDLLLQKEMERMNKHIKITTASKTSPSK